MATPALNPNTTPAMVPPTGQQPNFTDPPTKAWICVLVVVLALSLSTPFVATRMYTRKVINDKLWWDDWCSFLGWAFMVALCALLLVNLDNGGAVDQWNVTKAAYTRFTTLFHKIEIVARIGMFFTKASIILFYHRLFCSPRLGKGPTYWAIWFVFWWNLLYAVSLVLTVTTECVGKAAQQARGEACVNQYAVLICASVINVISDLMILIIPIAAIWRLQMLWDKKIRLFALFAVGILGVASSIARLGYQIVEAQKPNQTVIVMVISMMTIAEQTIGLVVGCMPILPTFLRHIFDKGSKIPISYPRSGGSGPTKSLTGSVPSQPKPSSRFRQLPEDPYFLRDEYEELGGLESQQKPGRSSKTDVIGKAVLVPNENDV